MFSVILVRVCILYIVNLTITSLYTILNISVVYLWLSLVEGVVRILKCIMTAQTKYGSVVASVNH